MSEKKNLPSHGIDTTAGAPASAPSNLEGFAKWYARSFWAHKGNVGKAREQWKRFVGRQAGVRSLVERAAKNRKAVSE